MATATTSLKLDIEMKAKVQQIAAAQRRSPHWVMREAIGQYVEREGRREELRQEVISRWEHYRATGLHVSGEAADAWLAKLEAGEDAEIPECHV